MIASSLYCRPAQTIQWVSNYLLESSSTSAISYHYISAFWDATQSDPHWQTRWANLVGVAIFYSSVYSAYMAFLRLPDVVWYESLYHVSVLLARPMMFHGKDPETYNPKFTISHSAGSAGRIESLGNRKRRWIDGIDWKYLAVFAQTWPFANTMHIQSGIQ